MKDRCDESGCGCRAADTEPPIPVTDMTLRDHSAACALIGMLSGNPNGSAWPEPIALAMRAYRYADAMLAERAKGGAK